MNNPSLPDPNCPDPGNPPSRFSFAIPKRPGETPRAYAAFITWFQLGHGRTLQAVADKLDASLATVKVWSSKHDWAERLQAFQSGLLEKQTRDEVACQQQLDAQWAERLNRLREKEWDVAQKLLDAAECFLENFGDEELSKMNLASVARALRISSAVGRIAVAGGELPSTPDTSLSIIDQQFLEAANRLYGQAAKNGSPGTTSPASDAALTKN